jgi:hypothetical protein
MDRRHARIVIAQIASNQDQSQESEGFNLWPLVRCEVERIGGGVGEVVVAVFSI